MSKIEPNYIELSATNLAETKSFYTRALGFSFTDYGPAYAAAEGGAVDIGIRAAAAIEPPLPTFESQELEATLASVQAAGGVVVKEIFAYPGGRRFEFLDPSGNRIAIYQKAPDPH